MRSFICYVAVLVCLAFKLVILVLPFNITLWFILCFTQQLTNTCAILLQYQLF